MAFLARHGIAHRVQPSEINFRANIHGFRQLGVSRVISASAVGSMREEIEPLHLVVPDQMIDRTVSRSMSFFGDGIVAHVSLADPFCSVLRDTLIQGGQEAGARVHARGTYLCMEGPQFSTRAESNLFRSWGVAVIGMTNLPEARLAREAELCYSTLALVTDYDCWRETEDDVSVDAVLSNLRRNADTAARVLKQAIRTLPAERSCGCGRALATALITQPPFPAAAKRRLGLLIGPYDKSSRAATPARRRRPARTAGARR